MNRFERDQWMGWIGWVTVATLLLLALSACQPLFTGPTCSHDFTTDTLHTEHHDDVIVSTSKLCLGEFR